MNGPSGAPGDADASVRAALARSHLGSLPEPLTRSLLASAHVLTVPAGATLHREGDAAAHLNLVVDGLLRVYITALDGRTLTVRYCRRGAMLGAVSLFASPFSMPASVQAVTSAQILSLSAPAVADAVERDVVLARALIDELSDRVLSFIAEIPGSAFATVRQRVARHLLDLATAGQTGPVLTATISQQELADAVGSVREVVVRALRELRAQGVIETGRNRIRLLDPQALATEAAAVGGGTDVPDRRNPRR